MTIFKAEKITKNVGKNKSSPGSAMERSVGRYRIGKSIILPRFAMFLVKEVLKRIFEGCA